MEKVYSPYQHQSKNFKPERLNDYKLCVFIMNDLLIYSILSEGGKILIVKEYRTKETTEVGDFLDTVLSQDYFLKEEYSEVKIITGVVEFSLVPGRFFQEGKTAAFAKALLAQDFPKDFVTFKALDNSDAVAVYTIPNLLKARCDNYFNEPEYAPYCQPAVGMGFDLSADSKNLILVNVFGRNFVITGIKNEQLHICNAYSYNGVTDIVYFVQLVQEVMGLEEQHCEIFLTGEFESESELLRQLTKYIPTLKVPGEELRDTFDARGEKVPSWKYAFMTY